MSDWPNRNSLKFGWAAALCWMAAGLAAGQAVQGPNQVVAEIEGYQLTRAEMERILQVIPEAVRKEVDTPQGRANFIRNYLLQKAMALEALALGLDEDPTVQMELRINREQVLAEAYRSRQLQKIQVTDQEVEEHYQQNKERFKHPVMVRLNRIIVASRKEAQEIIARANDGTSFAELASSFSKDIRYKDRGGRVGWVQPGQMEPAVEQVIFDLAPGQIGPPVRTVQGWHILQVIDRREAGYFPFDTMREPLKKKLLEEKQKEAAQSIGQKAFEKRGGKIHSAGRLP